MIPVNREPYFIPTSYYGSLAGQPDRGSLRESASNQSFSEVADYALDIDLAVAPGLKTKKGSWRIWRNERVDVSSIATVPKIGVDVAVYDPDEGLKARNLILGIGRVGFSTESGFRQVLEVASNNLIERPGYFHIP